MSKKISLVLSCLICVFTLFAGVCLATPTSTNLKQVYAADSGELSITVTKVKVTNMDSENATTFNEDSNFTNLAVNSGGIVEINTSESEAIKIETKNNTSNQIIIQSVDLKLNGYTLLHNWQTNDSYNYSQYLFGLRQSELGNRFCYDYDETDDLPTTQTGYATTKCIYTTQTTSVNGKTLTIYKPRFDSTIKKDNAIELVEGYYKIEIGYTAVGGNETNKTASFDFYMYRTDTFSPAYESPTFDNTQKIEFNGSYERPTDPRQWAPKLNYFNFNNKNTTAWDKTTSTFKANTNPTDKLYYPTISYNPEKFNLSYVYNHYGYQENVTTKFEKVMNGTDEVGKLTVTNTITDVASSTKTTTFTLPRNANGTYTINIVFEEVGEYTISKTAFLSYTVVDSQGNKTAQTKTIDDTINPDLVHKELLIINGFVPEYALNQNENATMYSSNYYNELTNMGTTVDKVYAKLFKITNNYTVANRKEGDKNKVISADFTFATSLTTTPSVASDSDSINNTITKVIGNTKYTYIMAGSETQVASTNLPPVSFKYYGRIDTSKSWFAYKGNNATDFDFPTYTANKNFKDPGEYFVLLNYSNLLKSQSSDIYNIPAESDTWQLFHFKITNEQAQLRLMQDLGGENSQQLTRQYVNTPVFTEWNIPSPFDSPVKVEISTNNGQSWTDITTQGNRIYEGESLDNFVTFNDNADYVVRIYKIKNSQSLANYDGSNYSVNYRFSIDRNPISGVKAMKVENRQISTTMLSSNDNYNLIVSNDFAWTWDEKTNGNTITAKYVYASIIDDISETYTITDNIISSKYKVNEFTAPITYIRPTPNASLSPVNQIVANSQIAILMLSDLAGNTTAFVTILDKTKTEILTPIYVDDDNNPETSPSISGYEPVNTTLNVKEDIEFIWGTHKSMNLTGTNTGGTEIYTNIKNINGLLDGWTCNGKSYNIDSIKDIISGVLIGLNNNAPTKLCLPVQKGTISVNEGNLSRDISNNWKAKLAIKPQKINGKNCIISEIFLDESETAVLNVTKEAEVAASNRTTYTFNIAPSTNVKATVNMDNSESKVLINGEESRELAPNGVTNADMIQFRCKNSEEFPIESITLEYYTFDFSNKNSPNYPFSELKTTRTLWSNSGASANEIVIDYILKLSTGNTPKSREGKYVITRTYETLSNDSTDVKDLVLTYYVDRHGIIPLNKNDYGDDIFLTFKDNSNNDIKILNGSENLKYDNLYLNVVPIAWENLLSLDGEAMVKTNYRVTVNLGNLLKYDAKEINKLFAVIVNDKADKVLYTLVNENGILTLKAVEEITPGNSTPYQIDTSQGYRVLVQNVGKYRVILFDSANIQEVISDINSMEINQIFSSKTYKPNYTAFSFEITETDSPFKVVAGDGDLGSNDPNQEAIAVQNFNPIQIDETDQKYYTNKNHIALSWTNPQSEYMAYILNINDKNVAGKTHLVLDEYIQNGTINIEVTYSNGLRKHVEIVVNKEKPVDTIKNLINNDKMISIVREIKGSDKSNYETFFITNEHDKFISNYAFSLTNAEIQSYLIENGELRNRFYIIAKSPDGREQDLLLQAFESESKQTQNPEESPYINPYKVIIKDNNLILEIKADDENPLLAFQPNKTFVVMEANKAGNVSFFRINVLDDATIVKIDVDTSSDSLTNGTTLNSIGEFAFVNKNESQTPVISDGEETPDLSDPDAIDPDAVEPNADPDAVEPDADPDADTPPADGEGTEGGSPSIEPVSINSSWNIPKWLPITITNSITNAKHHYFLLENSNSLTTVFSRQNLNNQATIVNSIRHLIDELNLFVESQASNAGAHFVLSIPISDGNQENFEIFINQAGDPLDLSESTFFTRTDNSVSLSESDLSSLCSDSTFVESAQVAIFKNSTTPTRTINVIENGVIVNGEIQQILKEDLVKIFIVDNFGRGQHHLIDNPDSPIELFSVDYMNERNENYPLTPIEFNRENEIYNYTIDDFSFSYNNRFNLKVTITDVDIDAQIDAYIVNGYYDSSISSQIPANWTYKYSDAWSKLSGQNKLVFKAIPNAHILISIELRLGDVPMVQNSNLNFAIYTKYPKAIITNGGDSQFSQSGTKPIITGSNVKVKIPYFTENDFLFKPKVKLIYRPLNEDNQPISEQTTALEIEELANNTESTFTNEGYYTIVYENEIGVFTPSDTEITFTIMSGLPALYSITIKSETNEQNFDYLRPVDSKLKYTDADNKTMYLTHYIFQHKNQNTDGLLRVGITTNDDKNIQYEVVNTLSYDIFKSIDTNNGDTAVTQIYSLHGNENNYINLMFAVTCVTTKNDTLNDETQFTITDSTRTTQYGEHTNPEPLPEKPQGSSTTIFIHQPNEENEKIEPVWAELNWVTSFDQIIGTNKLEFTNFFRLEMYEGEYIAGKTPAKIETSGKIKLTNTGIYTIRVVDQLGRYLKFDGRDYFVLTLLNDVPFYAKLATDESANIAPIPYQTFNDEVSIYVPTFYGTVSVAVKRNNVDFEVTSDGQGIYKFNLPGTYNVVLTANISQSVGTSAAPLKSTYNFTILSKEIAIKSYNFAPISGHKITSVERLVGEDEWQEMEGFNGLYTLYIDSSKEDFGEGEYRLNVSYTGAYANEQNYSFSFWISDSEPSLTCSRAWGSSATSPFEISFNPSLIYKSVGDCQIVVSSDRDSQTYTIDKSSLEVTDSQSMRFESVGVYVIQIVSADGTILSTYRMTIKTPLNGAAILIIILGVGAVAFGVFAFFKLRRKMKVR